MKKELNLLKALSLADEEYIEEAAPKAITAKNTRPKRPLRPAFLVAAMLLLLATGMSMLFFADFGGPTETYSTTGNESAPYVTQSDVTEIVERADYDPQRVAVYLSSPYYEIIEELDRYHYELQQNSQYPIIPVVTTSRGDAVATPIDTGEIPLGTQQPAVSDPVLPEEREDVTDNQVAGVIEADLFKRSDTHVFYLSVEKGGIFAYSLEGEDAELSGKYTFPEGFVSVHAMYLSTDGKSLCYFTRSYSDGKAYLDAVLVDVSDPSDMKEKSRFSIKGSYMDSRKVGDQLLLFVGTPVDLSITSTNYTDPTDYIPSVGKGSAEALLPTEDIILPDVISTQYYTSVCLLNFDSMTLMDCKSYLNDFSYLYMTKERIYLADNRYSVIEENGRYRASYYTDVLCLAYGEEGFALEGKVTVEGYLKDQYSMDEYNGTLRLVTTVEVVTGKAAVYTRPVTVTDTTPPSTPLPMPSFSSSDWLTDIVTPVETTSVETTPPPLPETAIAEAAPVFASGSTSQSLSASFYESVVSASLYCISLDDFTVVASVPRFSPKGETVQSVRFDGDSAYVCTAVRFTDPVFFFDLSDLAHITYKDTGNIKGYSSSLVNFGDGILLGIGYGSSTSEMKLSIYREGETGVEEIDSYLRWVNYSSDYKAYFIDRERQLVGLGVWDYDSYSQGGNEYYYLLLHFNGTEFVEVFSVPLQSTWLDRQRALLYEGYFYMLDDNNFVVLPLPNEE